jgi:hypothetical protein
MYGILFRGLKSRNFAMMRNFVVTFFYETDSIFVVPSESLVAEEPASTPQTGTDCDIDFVNVCGTNIEERR